jgi:hypothetical protein
MKVSEAKNEGKNMTFFVCIYFKRKIESVKMQKEAKREPFSHAFTSVRKRILKPNRCTQYRLII